MNVKLNVYIILNWILIECSIYIFTGKPRKYSSVAFGTEMAISQTIFIFLYW